MISTNTLIKKRYLIAGSNGMLGQRVAGFFKKNPKIELLCCSAEKESYIPGVGYITLDISDKTAVKKIVKDFYPDVIINCAAFSNVDKSESEKETAWKVNVTGTENLGKYAKALGAKLIHISSDYIFDGENGPYSEEDKPNPVSYYGRTKLASENVLMPLGINHAIIRTNVLYGVAEYGRPDFVKWVVSSLKNRQQIRIVDDQYNNPTFTDDIVFAINRIIEYGKRGVFNIGGPEVLNRYEFTKKIADFFGLETSLIKRIKTEELGQAAVRPLNSGLITLKAETELNYKPHTYEETFSIMRKELKL